MKLRILGDTLRVRLAQGEVTRLVDDGRVEETIHFGPSAPDALRYCVEADAGVAAIEAALSAGGIVVVALSVPAVSGRPVESVPSGAEPLPISPDPSRRSLEILPVLVSRQPVAPIARRQPVTIAWSCCMSG
jgi:hypothetical protein